MEKKTNVIVVTTAVFLATFMTAVEGTIVTTAMPTIIGSLHGIEIMNWVFSIYLLTNAMLTPIAGKLADRYGRKTIFQVGTAFFILGSALCGLSNNMLTLIISRAIQGIGAGAMTPVAMTILADLYSAEKRAKMLGLNSMAWGVASVIGPLAGGVIVDTVGWHWIFFINVPIGLLLIVLMAFFLFEEKYEQATKKMDFLGSTFLMILLMSLLLAFQFLGENGLDVKVIALFATTILFFLAFLWIEKRAEDPVISLVLFKNPIFVVVNVVAALVSGFLMALDVYIPMWMQGVLGYSAGIGGLVLAPMSILWVYGSNVGGRWLASESVYKSLMKGLVITVVGSLSLTIVPSHAPFLVFALITSIIGVGLGATITLTIVSAQNSVAKNQLGVATSFVSLVRTIAQTIMVSIFGLVFNQVTATQLATEKITDDPDIMNKLVNPQTAKLLSEELLIPLREVLYKGLHGIFFLGFILVVLAVLFTQVLRKNKEVMKLN